MTQAERIKAAPNGKLLNPNYRSQKESKLNRRLFSFSVREQNRILKYYRDKGLAYGQASR